LFVNEDIHRKLTGGSLQQNNTMAQDSFPVIFLMKKLIKRTESAFAPRVP
jgi:hypothetical protein